MKFGLQIYSFTWPGGPVAIGPSLARAVRTADEVGFDSVWVMDHFWQIGGPDSELQPMLEGWTTLGFMAANSERARLGLMVGGVHYRNPGLWVKAATTLDVLSGGRAWLGIGAGWNQAESEGLGFTFPPLGERFEQLEDTLLIARGMWQGERGTEEDFQGRRFHASRLLNVPQSISRPHVPIMIGGGGEKRTLRLVAQYADASNLFGGPEQLVAKYAILAQHCEAVGRDFAEIERTNLQGVVLSGRDTARGRRRESPDQLVERFGRLAEAGVQHVILSTATPTTRTGSRRSAGTSSPSSGVSKRPIHGASHRALPEGGRADRLASAYGIVQEMLTRHCAMPGAVTPRSAACRASSVPQRAGGRTVVGAGAPWLRQSVRTTLPVLCQVST